MRLTDLRSAWSGLTARGTSFLTAGVVAFACALLLGQSDLVRVAALLAVLPVVVVLVMAAQQLHLAVTRVTDPPRGSVGEHVDVHVEVVNRAGRRTPLLLLEDTLPAGLVASTRVVLPPLRPREAARVAYRLLAARRGRYAVGPARLVSVEPFGLVERTWEATSTDELLVRPVVHELPGVLPVRRTGRGGDSDLGGAGVAGDADLNVREYRQGDDLRRVHWPTTARRGELMVRPDMHPQDHNAVVVVDTRAEAHRGEGDASSLEDVVSAAASLAVHASDLGQRVVLLGDGQEPLLSSHDSAHRDAADDDPVEDALDRLALVRAGGADRLGDAVEQLPRYVPSTVVAVLGEVGPEDVENLAGSCRDAVRAALVCETTTWEQLSPGRARGLRERHDAAVSRLADAGWRVAVWRAGEPLADVWARLEAGAGVHA
ncbi:DUF58 domain-containing protein [Aquipuribacter sp. SD81]|uniref:DUF58 domain-containing protein n=1 Tax=Aquipuribacter sp. SD81 TaxID=3127703 RepID=UPI0030179DB8